MAFLEPAYSISPLDICGILESMYIQAPEVLMEVIIEVVTAK
jgi:hypothetical protein